MQIVEITNWSLVEFKLFFHHFCYWYFWFVTKSPRLLLFLFLFVIFKVEEALAFMMALHRRPNLLKAGFLGTKFYNPYTNISSVNFHFPYAITIFNFEWLRNKKFLGFEWLDCFLFPLWNISEIFCSLALTYVLLPSWSLV